MRQLLYEHSVEVKRQAGQETLIVTDRALKPLTPTCRRISCTHILLKEQNAMKKKLFKDKQEFLCSPRMYCSISLSRSDSSRFGGGGLRISLGL